MGAQQDLPWHQVGELVARQLGLHFPPARLADLQRGVTLAAHDLGWPDADGYVQQLLATPPAAAQLQQLARHLTVGETYFFRDPQQLKALAWHVLPALLGARRGREQRLRLWSAGCASGEEAYTLAILLHQALPDLADWHVTITATDINPAALQKAQAGVYGGWSFRNAPPGLKERYFEPRPDGRFALLPAIRRLVKFELLNLAQDPYPALATDTNAMDIVFCRNVLMYFTPAQAQRVVARLRQALVDGGWLAVSPSEGSQSLLAGFAAVNHPGAILYRKTAPAAPPAAAAAPLREDSAPTEPRALAALARTAANEGRLAQALAWCDRWIAADKVDPAAHYLRGVVAMEQGLPEAARTALRRALFLGPDFVLAHVALGHLARREGEAAYAARHFANAQALLAGQAPDAPLPEGDGLSAGALAASLAALRDTEDSA